jgi:hypothetical protein
MTRLFKTLSIAALFAIPTAAMAQHPTQPGGVFCISDLTQDLITDGADLGLFLLAWDTDSAAADFDHSGTVDGGDLGALLLQWGTTCHPFHANVEISIEGDFVVITGNGIPDHAMGNFPGECNNPNSINAMNDEWMLPITPMPTNNPSVDVLDQLGPIGIWVNGLAYYNPYDGPGTDAPASICFDVCNNHPSPDGRLHTHQFNPCIEPYSGGHSVLIGYAFDGLPVYGPYEQDGVLAAELSGADALDECNGHYDEWRGYHYHSISRALAVSSGIAGGGFPYILGCFHAQPEMSNFAGGGGGGGGGGGCDYCAANMIPPPLCNCVHTTPGLEYCCDNWDAACEARLVQCGG